MTLEQVADSLHSRKAGTSLSREFYIESRIFEIERNAVFNRSWILAGHVSEINNVGDYFCVEFDQESYIVVRQSTRAFAGFVNLCLHRGSRIVTEQRGHLKCFSCPYHNWIYGLDGTLLNARDMPKSFSQQSIRLIQRELRVISGLIFLSVSDDPAIDFDAQTNDFRGLLAPLRLEDTKVAARSRWTIQANWKLLIENFDECYHCDSLHPQYCEVMAHARAEALGSAQLQADYEARLSEWRLQATALGRSTIANMPVQNRAAWCGRFPLKAGCQTQSRTGRLVAPLLGGLSPDGGTTSLRLYPLTYIIIPADYAVLVRFFPMAAESTHVDLTWIVASEAEEGVDYDKDELMYLWRETTEQDNAIVALNQQGVRSRFWTGGYYSNAEEYCEIFLQWYTNMMTTATERSS